MLQLIAYFVADGNLCSLFFFRYIVSARSKNGKNPPFTAFLAKRTSVIRYNFHYVIRFIEFSDHECKCYL